MKTPQIYPDIISAFTVSGNVISRTALRKDELGGVKTRTANERHDCVACLPNHFTGHDSEHGPVRKRVSRRCVSEISNNVGSQLARVNAARRRGHLFERLQIARKRTRDLSIRCFIGNL